MDTWHPQRINKGSGQVTIPKKVLLAAGIEQGDDVYVRVNPDDPRTILVIPATLLDLWVDKGRRVDGGVEP